MRPWTPEELLVAGFLFTLGALSAIVVLLALTAVIIGLISIVIGPKP